MSKDRREIIIDDTKNNIKFPGLIKKAYWKDKSIHPYQFFLISNVFNGSRCQAKDREGFNCSWILTEKLKEEVDKINLDKMKIIRQQDWMYDFPYTIIGSNKQTHNSYYRIYFKNNNNDFGEISL